MVAAALFVFLCAVYLVTTTQNMQITSDEGVNLALVENLAKELNPDASRRFADSALFAPAGLPLRGDVEQMSTLTRQVAAEFGLDGLHYSKYGPAQALLAVPFYWLAQGREGFGVIASVLLLNSVLTAGAGAFIYLLARQLGYGVGLSLLLALLYGLCSPVWAYSKRFMSEPLSALALAGAAYFTLRARQGQRLAAIWGGLFFGLAVLNKLANLAFAPLYLLFLLLAAAPAGSDWRRRLTWPAGWARAVAFGLPVALAAGAFCWYNWVRFGDLLHAGYGANEGFNVPPWEGLAGLLFSPGKSAFLYFPLLLLVPFWSWQFVRRRRAEGLFLAGLLVAHFLLYATWWIWWGGWNWGVRFLIPAWAFAILLLGDGLAGLSLSALMKVMPMAQPAGAIGGGAGRSGTPVARGLVPRGPVRFPGEDAAGDKPPRYPCSPNPALLLESHEGGGRERAINGLSSSGASARGPTTGIYAREGLTQGVGSPPRVGEGIGERSGRRSRPAWSWLSGFWRKPNPLTPFPRREGGTQPDGWARNPDYASEVAVPDRAGLARGRAALVAMLVALSFGIQVLGVLVDHSVFLASLLPLSQDPDRLTLVDPARQPMLNQFQFLPGSLDFAWLRGGAEGPEVDATALRALLVGLAVGLGALAVAAWRRGRGLAAPLAVLAAVLAVGWGTGVNLEQGFAREDRSARQVQAALVERGGNAAVVYLAPTYQTLWVNAAKAPLPTWGTYEENPLKPATKGRLEQLAARYDTVWLVSEYAPGDKGNGIESWLALHAFRLSERWYGPFRLAGYRTGAAAEASFSPLAARFGDGARLLGYSVEDPARPLRPGETVNVTLRWRCERPLGQDYTVFVHLLDGQEKVRGQQDVAPGGGFAPTSRWQQGEVLVDRYALPLDAATPAGELRIEIGMYLPANGERLPVLDDAGQNQGSRVVLPTTVQVTR